MGTVKLSESALDDDLYIAVAKAAENARSVSVVVPLAAPGIAGKLATAIPSSGWVPDDT
jgi:hypothetical protein